MNVRPWDRLATRPRVRVGSRAVAAGRSVHAGRTARHVLERLYEARGAAAHFATDSRSGTRSRPHDRQLPDADRPLGDRDPRAATERVLNSWPNALQQHSKRGCVRPFLSNSDHGRAALATRRKQGVKIGIEGNARALPHVPASECLRHMLGSFRFRTHAPRPIQSVAAR